MYMWNEVFLNQCYNTNEITVGEILLEIFLVMAEKWLGLWILSKPQPSDVFDYTKKSKNHSDILRSSDHASWQASYKTTK
jgi:hypothetical protein